MICDKIVRLGLDEAFALEIQEILSPYTNFELIKDDKPQKPLEPVRLFAWSGGPGEDNKNVPFFWFRNDASWTGADGWAERCAEDFATRDKGDRCLFVWKPVWTNGYPTAIPGDEYYDLLKNGPDLSAKEYFTLFFQILKEKGQSPDVIVLDYEGGPTLYGKSTDADYEKKLSEMQKIWAEPELLKQLPDYFQNAEPEWVMKGHQERNNFHHYWGVWSSQFKARVMKELIYDAYFEIYNKEIPFSNYGDKNRTFPTRSWNGRVTDYSYTSTGYSSPVNYVLKKGHTYQDDLQKWRDGKAKHPRWGLLIDTLNLVRSCVNSEGADKVIPWMTCLGYEIEHNKWTLAPDFVDIHLQGHCIMSGISRFHYWNPGPPSQWPDATRERSDAALHALSGALTNARLGITDERDWKPIDRDADVFVTNGFSTRYEDFEKYGISAQDF